MRTVRFLLAINSSLGNSADDAWVVVEFRLTLQRFEAGVFQSRPGLSWHPEEFPEDSLDRW